MAAKTKIAYIPKYTGAGSPFSPCALHMYVHASIFQIPGMISSSIFNGSGFTVVLDTDSHLRIIQKRNWETRQESAWLPIASKAKEYLAKYCLLS